MARQRSFLARQAEYAQQTGLAVLHLLELTHDDLPAPLRFVRNNEDFVFEGQTWVAAFFDIDGPDEEALKLASSTLTLQLVDRSIVDALASIIEPIQVQFWIVASDDASVLRGPVRATWRQSEWNVVQVTGSLEPQDDLNENDPKHEFNEAYFPGIF